MTERFSASTHLFSQLQYERRGHTATQIANNKLLIIGGESDGGSIVPMVEILNLNDGTCLLHAELDTPTTFHQSLRVKRKHYLLGGYTGFSTKSELSTYSLTSKRYRIINKKGIGKRIDAFSMTLYYKREIESSYRRPNKHNRRLKNPEKKNPKLMSPHFLIFGGWDGSGLRYNDLYSFNIQKNRFKKIEPCGAVIPQGRTGHTAVYFNTDLIIFGGNNGKKRLNDVFRFRSTTREWKRWKTGGSIPERRSGHCARLFKSFRMIVVGGFTGKYDPNDEQRMTNDVFILNLVSKMWSRVELERGLGVPMNVNPTLNQIGDERFILIGGYDVLRATFLKDVSIIDLYSWSKHEFGIRMLKECKKWCDCIVRAEI